MQERWGVDTLWQVVIILVIFAITGMSALYVKKLFFSLLGLGPETPYWLRTVTWLLTVLPSYQVLFLFYGFLLGQFDFVWKFEKESIRKIMGLFKRKNPTR